MFGELLTISPGSSAYLQQLLHTIQRPKDRTRSRPQHEWAVLFRRVFNSGLATGITKQLVAELDITQ